MKTELIATAALMIASLGTGSAANAQAWGPPPPPPPFGYGPPPPPPGPPPVPGSRVVQRWSFGRPGYQFYHPRCWIEYRNSGWEMVKVCQ